MQDNFIPADEDTVRFGIPLRAPKEAFRLRGRGTTGDLSRALIAEIAARLDGSNCFVAFSGGCDSSLVLSAATRACREQGYPQPVPVTLRYEAGETQEAEHQEAMIEWLGLRDWVKIERGDEADLVGPAVTSVLRETGLIWPGSVHSVVAPFEQLGSGVLLTGEGGDEVLGRRRSSPLAETLRYAIRGRRRPPPSVVRDLRHSLVPERVRRRQIRRELADRFGGDWLEPVFRRALVSELAALEAHSPFSPRGWLENHLAQPWVLTAGLNLRAGYARIGLRWEAPLLAPAFLEALSGSVPWWEYRGRAILLRHYFADLLPPAIIDRRTKAVFNAAYHGRHTREFADRWTGGGLPEGVDVEWLQRHWRTAPRIHAGTSLLLQHAWLATEGPSIA